MIKIIIAVLFSGILVSCLNSKEQVLHKSSEFEDIHFQIIADPNSSGEYDDFILIIKPISKVQLSKMKEYTKNNLIDFQENLSVITQKDTLQCDFFYMEPLMPDNSYRALLSFQKINSDENDFEIQFDAQFFNKPVLTFKFPNL